MPRSPTANKKFKLNSDVCLERFLEFLLQNRLVVSQFCDEISWKFHHIMTASPEPVINSIVLDGMDARSKKLVNSVTTFPENSAP